jgi:NAD(P)-dependent dehydrogenase (short-subunit alcohol dehydrogenase family)
VPCPNPLDRSKIITGASTGIGYELAQCYARDGYDLVVAADEGQIEGAARDLGALGGAVDAVEAYLATVEKVLACCAASGDADR